MTAAIILAVMLSMPQHHADRHETREQRAELLRSFAEAVARNARDETEAAWALAQSHHESGGWARYIGEGRCLDGPKGQRCDPDRHGVPRAVGFLQVWEAHCKASATVDGQVRCALRLARHGRATCPHTGWLGAFSAQLGGSACNAPWAARRVRTMRESLLRIQRATWEAKR